MTYSPTTIIFRTKAWGCEDGTALYQCVTVPTFTRKHCDLAAFRAHPYFGGFVNSNLFPQMLALIRQAVMGSKYAGALRLDTLPQGVTVDTSGFLAKVTIDVDQLEGLPAYMYRKGPAMGAGREASHEDSH